MAKKLSQVAILLSFPSPTFFFPPFPSSLLSFLLPFPVPTVLASPPNVWIGAQDYIVGKITSSTPHYPLVALQSNSEEDIAASRDYIYLPPPFSSFFPQYRTPICGAH